MGLDTSHDCWHGSYITFGEFRSAVFDAVFGGGPRERYAYFDEIARWQRWGDERMKDPLMTLLLHSDCDGEIEVDKQPALAARLEEVAPILPEGMGAMPDYGPRAWALEFAAGLRKANALGEPVDFH